MTTLEDRARAAMRAIADTIGDAPPLPLVSAPAPARRARLPRRLPPRHWGLWLGPVTAAVAVLAIAIALVVVRDIPGAPGTPGASGASGTPNRRPAPSVSPAGAPVSFPQYYVTFSQPRSDTTTPVSLVLGDTLTGKKLFTLQPPPGLSFAGITGADDDRTFVADAHRGPYDVSGDEGRSRTWYLVRVAGTGSRVSLTMTRLAIPATPVGTGLDAMALSPDGTMLAVSTTPPASKSVGPEVLRVYSVATGAVLHSWSAPAFGGPGYESPDDNTALAWVGNRALAYFTVLRPGSPTMAYDVMVLDLSSPNGNALADSRPAVTVPVDNWTNRSPFGCGPLFRGDTVITGDGKTFVCGGEGTSAATLPRLLCAKGPAWNTAAFAGFSLTTGKLTGFLSGYRTNCYGYALADPYPLWVNDTGSMVIGWMYLGNKLGGRFGVFSDGSFRPLPVPVPGNWYQYFSGSLLFMVAW